jgi:PRTRC genetic system protein F
LILGLPSLELIPPAFVANAQAGDLLLKSCATALAEANILRPEHLAMLGRQPYPDDDLKQLVATAISDTARKARPNPVAQLDLILADKAAQVDLEYAQGEEDGEPNASVILVRCHADSPVHQLIGPRILELESLQPGLGQTVLHWLSAGFNRTSRALDPITGYGWAQYLYWQGEPDERQRLEEELCNAADYWDQQQADLPESERKPFDQAAAIREINLFSLKEYNAAIPPWAGAEHRAPRWSREQLRRLRVPRQWRRVITATLAVQDALKDAPHVCDLNDLNRFEMTRWEVCPFLLRWSRESRGSHIVQDPLAMIWDDFLNAEFEAGETNLAANAVFQWHDPPSLVAAVRRLELWCRILAAAETLLTALRCPSIT